MGNPVLERMGSNVRAHRLEQGLSQEELASLSGLHRTYLSSLERGERNVGILNLVRLAGSLGVTVAALADGVETSRDTVRNGDTA